MGLAAVAFGGVFVFRILFVTDWITTLFTPSENRKSQPRPTVSRLGAVDPRPSLSRNGSSQ